MRGNTRPRFLSSCLLLVFSFTMLWGFPLTPSAVTAGPAGWYSQHWDSTSTLNYQCVDAVDSQTAWVGTSDGNLLKTTDGGTTWNVQYSLGADSSIFDIAAVNANTLWVVGRVGPNYGVIKSINGGTAWELQLAANQLISRISAVDANNAWVVGGPVIMRTTTGGSSWVDRSPPSDYDLRDIYAVSSSTVWAVGHDEIIVKTSNGGSSWTEQDTGKADGHTWSDLYGVSAANSSNGWAVGFAGCILHTTNGTIWTLQQSASTANADLLDVAAINTSIAWAVGPDTILKTGDGGATWGKQYPWPPDSLQGIDALDANTAWAVGGKAGIFHSTDGGGASPPRPYIDSVSGNSPHAGQSVWIYGSRFGSDRGTSFVSFGGVTATQYPSWQDNTILCVVPQLDQLPRSIPVTVTTSNGTSNEFNITVLPPFSIVTITSISPNFGFSSTVIDVTITGSGFQSGVSAYLERIIQQPWSMQTILGTDLTVVSSTTITCRFTLPSFYVSYAVDNLVFPVFTVRVVNSDGGTGYLGSSFTYLPNPCGAGAITPVLGLGFVMGLLSLAGTARIRRRRKYKGGPK